MSIAVIATALVVSGGMFLKSRWAADGTKAVVLGEVIRPGAAAGFNILLVTLDTTRADRLGLYGYKKAQTPALDSLLQHGVRFDDAVTSAPTTLPAHTTILTGRYPPHNAVRANGMHHLPDGAVTIAEMLKEQGYETAAFVSAFVLDKRFGLDQGFDVYNFAINRDLPHNELDLGSQRQAHEVTADALKWLNSEPNRTRPFFAWIHYFDAHPPYASPLQSVIADPYDAEIAFIDLHFKRLLEWLDAQKLRERTLIVVASDHGESLGEHGSIGHGLVLYEPEMRIAMLLSCPSLFPGPMRVDDRVVGSVDLVPTILELVGRTPPTPLDGQSLLTVANDPDRAIYIETCHAKYYSGCAAMYGLRRHFDKFILAPRSEYYDLRKDPGELRNLFGADLPAIAQLRQRLLGVMTELGSEGGAEDLHPLDDDARRRLAELGYIEVPIEANLGCDPKDQLTLHKQLARLNTLVDAGREEEAFPIAQELLQERPCWTRAVHAVASTYISRNDLNTAASTMENFIQHCSDPAANCLLADIYRKQGRIEDAKKQLATAAILGPTFGIVFECLGDIAMEEGNAAEAITQYEHAIEVDAVRVGADVEPKLTAARRKFAASP